MPFRIFGMFSGLPPVFLRRRVGMVFGVFIGSHGVSFAVGLFACDMEAGERFVGMGLYAGDRAGYERDVHFIFAL